MVIAITPGEEFDWVLLEDRGLPKEEQTVFRLAVITAVQRMKIEDLVAVGSFDQSSGQMSGLGFHKGTAKHAALRCGLRGWSNFNDTAGNPVPFEQDKMLNVLGTQMRPPTEVCLQRLPTEAATELAEAILENMRMTTEEGKGSA